MSRTRRRHAPAVRLVTPPDRRSFGTDRDIVGVLDSWFGLDAALWTFVNDRAIPAVAAMSIALAGMMLLAAIIHGDLAFAVLLGAIIALVRHLRTGAVDG